MDDAFAIEIVEVQENEDGSAVLTIEVDNRARELLIEAWLRCSTEKTYRFRGKK